MTKRRGSEDEGLMVSATTMMASASPTTVSVAALDRGRPKDRDRDAAAAADGTALDRVEPIEPLPPATSSAAAAAAAARGTSSSGADEDGPPASCAPWPVFAASRKSQRTANPIRSLVDPIFRSIRSGLERGDGKDPISLALGDPAAAGHLSPPGAGIEAALRALQRAPHAAGYVPACGTIEARRAVARFHSAQAPAGLLRVSEEQVVVASGCSGALELALASLLDDNDPAGSVLLVPRPGFPLYRVICESHGARAVEYGLDPHDGWQVDLGNLEQILRQHAVPAAPYQRSAVRGLVLNNPSNPTGSVYARSHLRDVVKMCERYRVPIVADEVYGNLTFGGAEFVSVAEVAAEMGREVPVVVASGIGKQFLLPGWRVGWIAFCDNRHGSLREVELGAKRLAQVVLGASHLAQSAVPALLDDPAGDVRAWRQELCRALGSQAARFRDALAGAPGLRLCPSSGAMYAMAELDPGRFRGSFGGDDVEFCSALLREENVVALPGACFGAPGYVRVAFCAPGPVLEEAAARLEAFCRRHASASGG